MRESRAAPDMLLRLSGDIVAVVDRRQAGELRGELSPEWLVVAYGDLVMAYGDIVVAALDQLDEQRLSSGTSVGDVRARTIATVFAPSPDTP